MTYIEAAMNSAQIYYNYLTDNNRGIVICDIIHIEPYEDFYILTLSGSLFSPDMVQIKIYNEIYTREQIMPVEYDEIHRKLKVWPNSKVRATLKHALIYDVAVISDLHFLVKRVEDWYRKYGNLIQIPAVHTSIKIPEFNILADIPSEDQKAAVEGALSSGFSYIWGASGTGKTRFVLARCILSYIKCGKKVLITAPTNNAVEQTLYGVLSVLGEAGVPLHRVFRLGTPSSNFADKYSSLCEDISVSDKIAAIDAQINTVKIGITKNDYLMELLPYFRIYNAFKKSFSECATAMPGLFDQLRMLYSIKTETIQQTRRKETRINECIILLQAYTKFWEKLNKQAKKISKSNLEQVKRSIYRLLERGRSLIESRRIKYEELRTVTENELYSRREEYNNRLNELITERAKIYESESNKKIRNCLVLAATVDTCISRVLPDGDFKPDHVFLEETGYCSLIKGVTLTAYNSPVTFLGDHMQLKPVSEMKSKDIKMESNAPVSLWTQSAIYAEDVFSKQPIDIFADYYSCRQAAFHVMKKYDLIHTYRFGKKLASVLAKNVYPSLAGDIKPENDIYYINAIRETDATARTSIAECNAIAMYLSKHNETDVGVITPYVNQNIELKKYLKKYLNTDDSVMTIHGSQRREWDTVFFSVVDTADMHLTDSLRKIINTAVSRAKKKLIIVCDADYWFTQPRQFITQLLLVAEKIEV